MLSQHLVVFPLVNVAVEQLLVQVLVHRLVRHLVLVGGRAAVDGLPQAHNHLHGRRETQYIREHRARRDQIIG